MAELVGARQGVAGRGAIRGRQRKVGQVTAHQSSCTRPAPLQFVEPPRNLLGIRHGFATEFHFDQRERFLES